jgi:hypothetical protein
MASELLECSWGKIRLFAEQVHHDAGRTQVVHELSSGGPGPVQNRALRNHRTRLNVQFDQFPGAPSPTEAAIALEAAKNTGQTAVFQHPLFGRWVASVGEFVSNIDQNSVITAEVEFIQESDDVSVIPSGAATSPSTGEAAVRSASAQLDGALFATGQLRMSSTAVAAVLSRSSPAPTLLDRINGAASAIDMTVDGAAAFVTKITDAVTQNANQLSSTASNATGAPVATLFSLEGAASSLNKLLLSPAGESLDASSVVPAPSGFGASDPAAALAAAASSDAANGLFSATTMDARVSVSAWNTGDVPTRRVLIDSARISNNIATMIEVGGFELDLALWDAFRAAIMLGDSVRKAAIAATSSTPSVFTMRIQQPTALLPLCARVYGGASAQERARQIVLLNDISTPGWLPPGDYLVPTRPPGAAF